LSCAKLGALAAAEIIQHIGARPQTDLAQLAAQNGWRSSPWFHYASPRFHRAK
jgi:hypothetical protein